MAAGRLNRCQPQRLDVESFTLHMVQTKGLQALMHGSSPKLLYFDQKIRHQGILGRTLNSQSNSVCG